MFYELALTLARELYPEPKKKGEKTKWTDLNRAILAVEIERLIREDGKSVSRAANCLAAREPWTSFLRGNDSNETTPDPGEALRRSYYQIVDDRLVRMLNIIFETFETSGRINQWDKYVEDFLQNPCNFLSNNKNTL